MNTTQAKRVMLTPETPWEQVPEVLTLRQAADWLGLSYRGANEMAHRGELPAARFGSHWKVSKRALAAKLQMPEAPEQVSAPPAREATTRIVGFAA